MALGGQSKIFSRLFHFRPGILFGLLGAEAPREGSMQSRRPPYAWRIGVGWVRYEFRRIPLVSHGGRCLSDWCSEHGHPVYMGPAELS